MYSCVLYGQTTDKGNEPDGRKIDYTDKEIFNKNVNRDIDGLTWRLNINIFSAISLGNRTNSDIERKTPLNSSYKLPCHSH